MKWIFISENGYPPINQRVLGACIGGDVSCIEWDGEKWHEYTMWGDCSCEWGHGGYDSEVSDEIIAWMEIPRTV